jgi:transcriptional regulator with XRE-family HTH domain
MTIHKTAVSARRRKKAASTGSSRSPSDLGAALANRIQTERKAHEWSLQEFSQRSGVSRAMISKIERAECSPTAAVLGRLSGALGISISALLAGAEESGKRLRRFEEQQVWIDPETKYVRRSVSPQAGIPLQLVDVELPPSVRVAFPASAYTFLHQQIWVLRGQLHFWEGRHQYVLGAGDCLQLSTPQDCTFENPSKRERCRYLVALIVR